MKYCSHCGKELLDQAVVCPECGCSAKSQETNSTQETQTRFCCPKCGSKKLTVVTDRNLAGALGAGAVGYAVGGKALGTLNAVTNLKQQTFFVCGGCGNKFRNPDELHAELAFNKKKKTMLNVCAVLLLGLALFTFICSGMAPSSVSSIFVTLGVICAILGGVVFLLARKLTNDTLEELNYIENGMKKYLKN